MQRGSEKNHTFTGPLVSEFQRFRVSKTGPLVSEFKAQG